MLSPAGGNKDWGDDDPKADQFMANRKEMLQSQANGGDDKNKVQLKPMGPLAASSTVVNLLLATGPFSYPYEYVNLGPILSTSIMLVCCILAYISATYMVEAIAMANSQDDNRRRDSLFEEECYKTP